MNSIKLFICVLALFSIVSCKKDKDKDETGPDTQKLITQTWKVAEVWINGNQDTNTDYTSSTLTFRSDSTYEFNLPSGTTSGTWELNSNKESVTLDKGTANEQLVKIIKLSNNESELEVSYLNYKDGNTTILYKLVK